MNSAGQSALNPLNDLVKRARAASPNERIDMRDPIAAHGSAAIDEMAEWLADPVLTWFAVRVIGRAADLGAREAAIETLRMAQEDATPDQRTDISAELHRLGADAQKQRAPRSGRSRHPPVDPSVPGWMMRTDRTATAWLWAEVMDGRLRQGWGYQPSQELTVLRDRRERREPVSRDEDWAWPNRRMMSDEPDGMQIGDLVLLPHLPREWRWSVVRIAGLYRFEIAEEHNDYGHLLPVDVVAADLGDDDLTPELRWMRTYPARLRRLSREAYEDLRRRLLANNAALPTPSDAVGGSSGVLDQVTPFGPPVASGDCMGITKKRQRCQNPGRYWVGHKLSCSRRHAEYR